MAAQRSGWGGQAWGSSPWGGAPSLALQLVAALAIAENVVQLTFSAPVYYSQLLDQGDASQPALFSFSPVAGTFGQDGSQARTVLSASVAPAAVQPSASQTSPSVLVVTLDRPLTPAPAQYVVQASTQLVTAAGGTPLNPGFAQAQFGGVFKKLAPNVITSPTSLATRDFASPDTLSAAQASGSPTPALLILGVPVIDDTGDYATDNGLVNLKKRVLRRILFVPGATVHLVNYGAGAATYGKRLASAANRLALAAACESQIAQEPDVAAVSCTIVPTAVGTGQFYLRVLVRSRSTGQGMKLLVPLSSSTGPSPGLPVAA